jgi:hypothetical protein
MEQAEILDKSTACDNCKGIGTVTVQHRSNEVRSIPCPICSDSVDYPEDDHQSETGC